MSPALSNGKSWDHPVAKGCNLILEWGEKLGADRVKAVGYSRNELRFTVENKKFSLAHSHESQGFSIVVHKDQRKSSVTINTTEEEALKAAVEDAVALSQLSVPDEYLTMADQQMAPTVADLPFCHHKSLDEVPPEELKQMTDHLLDLFSANPRIALDRLEMSWSKSQQWMVNSLDVRQAAAEQTIGWSYMGMAVDQGQVSGFDYDQGFSWNKDDVRKMATAEISTFMNKLVRQLNPIDCPSYQGTVLFSPRVVYDLLMEALLFHASGTSVMDGKSIWAQSIGTQVVSSKISLDDRPHNPAFSSACSYDGDGVPTKNQSLIEQGVLQTHLLDVYSANRIKKTTNGMAGGPFGLTMEAGTTPLQKLTNLGRPVLLVERFSGNTNPIKGDFSGVAKNSFLYHNGDCLGSVKETMIAGNALQILNAVVDMSLETERVGGQGVFPYLLCSGISVTGDEKKA